jgi:hypothetical protein
MTDNYMLDEKGEPVIASDSIQWGLWFQAAERHVADDMIGDVRVSTVFLGMAHGWMSGEPILWETMVFGGPLNGTQQRCGGARENAKKMHKNVKQQVIAQAEGREL